MKKHQCNKAKIVGQKTETNEFDKHRHTIVRQQNQCNEETIGTSKNSKANTETYEIDKHKHLSTKIVKIQTSQTNTETDEKYKQRNNVNM